AGKPRVDHSLGYAAAIFGYLVIAAAMLASAISHEEHAHSREFVARVLGFRPGLPVVVLGAIVTLLAFLEATWFAPNDKNLSFSETSGFFSGHGLNPLASQYLSWLGWVLFAAALVVAAAATWLRNRALGW